LFFSQLGVLGKGSSQSELLRLLLAFVHKAIEMAFFRSWRKGVLLANKKQKMHKRDKKMTKKVLYKHISSWIPH